ncbi:carbamoyltransferase family protein [Longitalea arenae]|uniref:carbamoyltransferase family protein n=1 Tax=Longitalea arenae TaxID=2812558 RepID=UPI0019686883|nr:carbamoyltransferase C-terminal domain-containing protein [Longitalea arenae]
MNILGINFYYHDSTACIVSDGALVVAIEEERLTRKKHTVDFPVQAINKCMEAARLTPADIDYIAVSVDPALCLGKKLFYGMKNLSHGRKFIWQELMMNLFWKRKRLKNWYGSFFKNAHKPPVHFIPHHLSHVVGTFLISPYESAALLSVDGSGEWATTFMGKAKDCNYTCFRQDYFPMSLGSVYEAVTQFCGFIPNYDEGKTMGLAPLGNPQKFYDKVSKTFWINDDLSIGVDLSYFKYQYYSPVRYSSKFVEVFGKPRNKDKRAPFEQHHLDIAAAFQLHLEECMLTLTRGLHKKTGEDYLVLAGGVALNSVANGRIVRESGFKDIYLMPAAGDNGTALGAAYYLYNCILKNKRGFVHTDPYVGPGYSNKEIEIIIKSCKLSANYYFNIEEKTAEILNEGKIVGWYQGGMEIGPRSLGNRSILANPTLKHMKDKVNAEVKHREAFRPFAPSCPIEDVPKYFEQHVADPFMLKVCNVLPDKREVVPAITHVDGTARLQTIHSETNNRFHTLLKEFEKLSGVPVLLNTSFNVMGEPIVESPYDAIRCFFTTGLDVLVLGNFIIEKNSFSSHDAVNHHEMHFMPFESVDQ